MTIQEVLQKFRSWEQVAGYSGGELNMLRACILEVESYAESQCESAEGDFISRQAALDDAHRQIWYRMNQQGVKDRIDEWLKNLPSAQPERKRGKWIGNPRHQACSECRITYCIPDGQDGTLDMTFYNFCPNCGADMRGEEDADNN